MLKFENAANIGSTIRAYDFKPMLGRPDSYIEGRVVDAGVTKFGYKAFTIVVSKEVYDGREYTKGGRCGELAYIPMECASMDYDSRIIDLTRI